MPDTIPPPAGDEPGDDIEVEFEQWALVSARLLGRTVIERAQTLRDSGLVASWGQIDEHWYEALVQDLDAGRLQRLDRYVDICVAERAARTEVTTLPGVAEAEDPPPSGVGAMSSATPPLGSSSESIEIDLADFELRDSLTREHEALAEDEDDDDGPHSDDTRVSAAFPELPNSEKDA